MELKTDRDTTLKNYVGMSVMAEGMESPGLVMGFIVYSMTDKIFLLVDWDGYRSWRTLSDLKESFGNIWTGTKSRAVYSAIEKKYGKRCFGKERHVDIYDAIGKKATANIFGRKMKNSKIEGMSMSWDDSGKCRVRYSVNTKADNDTDSKNDDSSIEIWLPRNKLSNIRFQSK